jgi:hypothetical protein
MTEMTPQSDLDPRFPAPPPVPWWALFVVLVLVNVLSRFVVPKPFSDIIPSIAFKTWAIYLCLWIRALNPKSISIYWVFGSLLCDLVAIGFYLQPDRLPMVTLSVAWLLLVGAGTSIACIYIIRHELLQHYNTVEPVGLDLSPVITFFFSYIYFQYHLTDIAETKRRETSPLST